MPPVPDAQRKVSGEHDLARWSRTLWGRMIRAWKRLPHERRLAVIASIGLFVVLFLPWYQETVVVPGAGAASEASASVTGWGHFSFVEAAVLLVSAGVLTLLFQRAEGRAFHLPGGDGSVIMVAGGWTCLLVIWQIFDKPSASIHGPGATISGIEWGIFAALAVAALLTYAGSLIRSAHRPEPPLPGEDRPAAREGIRLIAPQAAEAEVAEPIEDRRERRGPGAVQTRPEDPTAVETGPEDPTAVAAGEADRPAPARPAPSAVRAAGEDWPSGARPRGWLTRKRHPDSSSDSEQLTMPVDADS